MKLTEQIIMGLYAAAERQNRDGPVDEAIIADHAIASEMLRNGEVFRKDYGLISDFTLSRFNTDGEDWLVRKNLSQRYFGRVKSTEFAGGITRAAQDAFRAEADFGGKGARAYCLNYAAGNMFRAFGLDAVPDGFIDWVDKVRVVVQDLQMRTMTGEAGGRDMLSQKEPILAEIRSILPPSFGMYRTAVDRLGDEGKALEEMTMLLFGGVESTASTILWCMELLGRGLEYQLMLRQQDETRKRELVGVFINEVMRRFPAVPLLVRTPAIDTTIGKRHFQKGRPVMISIIGIHHDARNWEDPFVFDYRRREFVERSFRQGSYIPFSRGSRTCAGARLAADEIREAVLQLVNRFEIEQPFEKVAFEYGLTLNPAAYEHIRFRPLN